MALRFRNTTGDEYTRTTNLPASSAITFLCAVRVHTYKGLGFMFVLSQDSGNWISVNWGTNPQNMSAGIRIASIPQGGASVQGRVVLNAWMVAVLQRDAAAGSITGGLGRLYSTDPLAYATATGVSTGNFTPDTLVIGNHPDFAGDELDSEMACARIWTSILSPAAIERERQGIAAGIKTAIQSSNLHADYPFSGDATRDYSPNGYHLTAGTAVGALDPVAQKHRRRGVGRAVAANLARVSIPVRQFNMSVGRR